MYNLAAAVGRFFQRYREVPADPPADPPAPASEEAPPAAPAADAGGVAAVPASRELIRQRALWQAIHDRLAEEESESTIRCALRLHLQTVQRYARMPEPPAWARHHRPLQDRWEAVFAAAWAAGHHTVPALDAAVRALGDDGGPATVPRLSVEPYGPVRRPPSERRVASPERVGPLLPVRPRQMGRVVRAALADLTAGGYPTAERSAARFHGPTGLERGASVYRAGHPSSGAAAGGLDPASGEQRDSRTRRLSARRTADEAAVRAALREPWSPGRTEGFNHRIKRTLRLTYGRASFPLLRARLLAPRAV